MGVVKLGCVKNRLRRWGTVVLLCFLISCSAMDVWDEKAIQNIKKEKKKRDQTKHRPAGKFIVNVPFFFLSVLFFFFFFIKMRENGL